MKSPRFCLFFILPIFLTVSSVFAATGRQAMIATANPYATNAALEILKQGGNAA